MRREPKFRPKHPARPSITAVLAHRTFRHGSAWLGRFGASATLREVVNGIRDDPIVPVEWARWLLKTFGDDFDAAVVDVPHPALEAERRRPSPGMVAKEHSLNPSRNKRVSPCVHGRAKFSTSRPGRKEFGETLKDF
jgi:hypothetical protein